MGKKVPEVPIDHREFGFNFFLLFMIPNICVCVCMCVSMCGPFLKLQQLNEWMWMMSVPETRCIC